MTRPRALGVLAVVALILVAECSDAITDVPATTDTPDATDAPGTTDAPATTETLTTAVETPNGTLSVDFINI